MLHLKLRHNTVEKLADCISVGPWRVVCHYCDDMKVVRTDVHGQQLNVPGTSLLLHMNLSRVTPLVFHRQHNSPGLFLTTVPYNPVCSDGMKSIQRH